MRIPGAGLSVLVCLALAGCGGSGATPSSTTSRASAPGSTTSQATSATNTSTHTATVTRTVTRSSTPSTTTPSAAAPCHAGGLSLAFLGQQGATGHGELGFALRNAGTGSCTIVGYPGIQFLDRSGAALPTTPTHTTDDFFGHTPLAPVVLAPGQTASFRLGVSHAGARCATADGLQVISPNDTSTLRVALPGGASECRVTTVSPVVRGDGAYR